MRNYMRAELYKTFHRSYIWITLGIGLAIGLGGVAAVCYMNTLGDTIITFEDIMQLGVSMLGATTYTCVIFSDMFWCEEQKNHTLKNVIMMGVSRQKIYIAKIIVSCVVGVFLIVIIVPISVGTAWFALTRGNEATSIMIESMKYVGIAMCLWISFIAYGNVLVLVFKNDIIFGTIYALSIMFFPKILVILGAMVDEGFLKLYSLLPIEQLNGLEVYGLSNGQLFQAVTIGLISTAIWIVIGLVIMRKKEIN